LFGGGTPPVLIVQTTDSIGTGPRVTIGAGNTTFIELEGVSVAATDSADAILASDAAASLTVQNDGRLVGANAITANGNLRLVNGATGLIVGTVGQGVFAPGDSEITNFGTIRGVTGGADLGTSTFDNYGTVAGDVGFAGTSSLDNYGTMSGDISFNGGAGNHFYNGGTVGGDLIDYSGAGPVGSYHNAGTLEGFIGQGSNGLFFFNTGSILGSVVLVSGIGLFDSTLGKVFNIIDATASTGPNIVVASLIGGLVKGGAGDDIFYANPTQLAADNGANFQLTSGKGTNALYGSGAFTVFHVGTNATAGQTVFNQVWGGLSKMATVMGYANNTIAFDGAAAGVYVDLLNGHNAYASLTAGANWGSGPFALQDAIQNVPNVIGSDFGDVIIADNGIGRLTGGLKADQLYAGAGPSSQDTFVYTQYGDSNLVDGYDTIAGFKVGVDRIDFSALLTDASHLVIAGNANQSNIYIEHTPGTFNPATDLAISVMSTGGAVKASDFIF
jgi:hypothetical protein